MDSDNILSILAQLGGQSPAPRGIVPVTFQPVPAPGDAPYTLPPEPVNNVLQAVAQPPAAPVAAPTPTPAPVEHPRKRLSVIDVIGRLADTIATVGGSQPMYAPTLEHIQDRASQVDMDALKKRLMTAQVGEEELNPILAARKRMGTALGALAGNKDAAALWPSVAAQAGITDAQQVAAIGAQLEKNPGSAAIFAKALGADIDNLGKNVYFGTGPDGKTVAYQVGPDGNPHLLDFGATGIIPSDPIKVVDAGGSQVIVGSGGAPRRIIPKSVNPNTMVTTQAQRDIAAGNNRTQLTIAGMPARAQAGKSAGGGTGDMGAANMLLDNIERGFSDLHKMKALPGEGGAAAQIEGALGRTALGQHLGEQFGVPSAQKRLEIEKDINSLQSEMVKSLPASATRTKFEQEIQRRRMPDPARMTYATSQAVIADLRKLFVKAQQDAAAELARKGGTAAPVPATIRPTGAGWGKAKVIG
jgi:hypothetical protein